MNFYGSTEATRVICFILHMNCKPSTSFEHCLIVWSPMYNRTGRKKVFVEIGL